MARRAIPMIAFQRVRTIYILYIYIYIYIYIYQERGSCAPDIYILVSLARVCVVYVALRKLRHSGGLSQLMGVARNRTRARALQTSRKKEKYVETGTNS